MNEQEKKTENPRAPENPPPPAPTLPPAPRRRRWVSILLSLLLLLVGGVAGSALTVLVIVRRAQHAIHHPEEAPARIASMLKRKLDLSGGQEAAVREALVPRLAALQQIRRDVQPRVETEFNLIEADVARELTPKQQEEWSALFRRMRDRWFPPPPPAADSDKTTQPAK